MGIIVQGSSRKDGNTGLVAGLIAEKTGFEVVNLCEHKIGHFDYEFRNKGDDFRSLMKRFINDHDTIVFATPVYWYSMSGLMKALFDRFTDLLSTEKDLGRKLRGKNMAMLSCGSDENLPAYFEGPFEDTAGYLGMNYLGSVHSWVNGDGIPGSVAESVLRFADVLKNS